MLTSTGRSKEQLKALRQRVESLTIRNDEIGYDRFWADDELVDVYLEPARMANFKHVAQLCADFGGDVIDMGCGSGTMLAELLACDRTGAKRVWGIDYTQSAVNRSRVLLPQGTFSRADVCDTGLPGAAFDLVLSIQTMEHLADPKRAFEEMRRLVRPGGRILVTVPNGEIDDWAGHKNFWTADSFLAMAGIPTKLFQVINNNRNLLFLFVEPL